MKKITYITVAVILIAALVLGGCSQKSPNESADTAGHTPITESADGVITNYGSNDEFTDGVNTGYSSPPREHAEFTDGVVTATFDKEAGTLVFSGNGAIDRVHEWPESLQREERVFVRTIIFKKGITSIGSLEFSHDYINLEKVIFQGDINTIDSFAFNENRNLATVEFKGNCRTIEYGAFADCSALENINVPEGCVVDEDAFRHSAHSANKSPEESPEETLDSKKPTPPERPSSPSKKQME